VLPFHFGVPEFHLVPIVTMCIVMIVVMIESLGMFLALGEITGKKIDRSGLDRGLRADGVGTVIGGVFNTFPLHVVLAERRTCGVTGVRSRWVTVTGGIIMLILGLLPKMSALVEAVPLVVLGGAGLVMFGMVAATGARILTGVDFKTNQESVRGRDFGRLRHDPAGGAGLLQAVCRTSCSRCWNPASCWRPWSRCCSTRSSMVWAVQTLAAGHRPCFECRRKDALALAALFPGNRKAPEMDRVLHAERLDGKAKRTHKRKIDMLPDGAMIALDGEAFAVRGKSLLAWTPSGYGQVAPRPRGIAVDMLTPPSIASVLKTGYAPRWHPSAH
jgi:hypothetical protein